MRLRAIALAFGLGLVVAGCGGEDSKFGQRCSTNAACGEGGFCCEARECPGGFCTETCETDDECAAGNACVQISTRDKVCLRGCTSIEDCDLGTSLECIEIDTVRVCASGG